MRFQACLSVVRSGHKVRRGLTVGVATDEDSDAAAARDLVRRQGGDVPADGRPAQRRLPRTGLPAPHSRRPHGGRLPAWLHTHARTQKRHDVSTARGAHAGAWTRILARKNRRVPSTRGALITARARFQQRRLNPRRVLDTFNSNLIT